MPTIQEKIDKLKGMNDDGSLDDEIKKLEAQLKTGAGKGKVDTSAAEGEDWLGTNMTEEDYEKSSSLFAQAGEWPAEFGKPYSYSASSICFPFVVPASGYSAPFNHDGLIWAGVEPAAAFKLKEILTALGVDYGADAEGKVGFKPSEVEGKIGKVIYVVEGTYQAENPDTGQMEEKPSTLANPKSVIPITAGTETLQV